MIRVAQISDTHLSHVRSYAVPNVRAVLRAIVEDDPDFVVHTGDIAADDPDDAEERAFAFRLLSTEMPRPFAVIPGNHDTGGFSGDLWTRERNDAFRATWGSDTFSVDLDRWRLIGPNVYRLGEQEHDDWLAAQSATDRFVAVFVHQPMFLSAFEVDDDPDWSLDRERRRILRDRLGAADVRLIASGHLHRYRELTPVHVFGPSAAFLGTPADDGSTQVVGYLSYLLHDDGTVRHRLVVPQGTEQLWFSTFAPHEAHNFRAAPPAPGRPRPVTTPAGHAGGTAMGSLSDVPGLLVGHHRRIGHGWLTGTTVVLAPDGATAGVDVRGGAPGTRETDLLRPENLVQQVHAVCLTGGSAYGLAAADGVMAWLAARGIGYAVGTAPGEVVPIVPAAVIFDLGRGGRFDRRPDATFGVRACGAARRRVGPQGTVGAGTGALSAGIKGGLGTSSTTLPDGSTIGALAVVNSAGSVIDRVTGLPYETRGMDEILRRPSAGDRRRFAEHLSTLGRPLNTTIGVVATDAPLSKADCARLAGAAQDGLAHAARPAHLLVDGDAVFALSTAPPSVLVIGDDERFGDAAGRVAWLNGLLGAAADCFAAAVTAGVVHASGTATFPSYRDLCPSAFR